MGHTFTTGPADDRDDVPGMPAHPGYPEGTQPRDPDLDTLDQGEDRSDLDDLTAELTATVAPTTTIPVLGRAGYAVRFRTDFTGRDLDALRKKARNKRFTDGVDGIRFAALLLAFACQGITRNGRELGEDLNVDGPVTFTTAELQQLIGTDRDPNPADATVRKFYGLEGHVDSAARRLMTEAGWGDEVDAMDPTE